MTNLAVTGFSLQRFPLPVQNLVQVSRLDHHGHLQWASARGVDNAEGAQYRSVFWQFEACDLFGGRWPCGDEIQFSQWG